MSLLLLFNQVENVKLLEVLRSLEFLNNCPLDLGSIGGSSVSNEQDCRLDEAAKLLKGLVKVLLRVDNSEVRGSLQVGIKPLGILVILTDALREDGRGLISLVSLRERDHALLTEIFRALQTEDSGRRNAVFDEELGLELALGEVFEEDSRIDLLGEVLDESHGLGLLITVTQVVRSDKAVVVQCLHVGALT